MWKNNSLASSSNSSSGKPWSAPPHLDCHIAILLLAIVVNHPLLPLYSAVSPNLSPLPPFRHLMLQTESWPLPHSSKPFPANNLVVPLGSPVISNQAVQTLNVKSLRPLPNCARYKPCFAETGRSPYVAINPLWNHGACDKDVALEWPRRTRT